MHKELDDFEVVNSGNKNLLEAILYIQNNVNSSTWNKLKKVEWLQDATNSFSLIPYILESKLSKTSTSLFRKSNDSNDLFTSIWISEVASMAKEKLMNSKNIEYKFNNLSREALYSIGKIASDPSSLTDISNLLYREFRIILLYIDNIPGMKTDAVTFILESGHPVVGMSLRYARYDYFWFTLMHELSHIHLHFNELTEPHVDKFYEGEDNERADLIDIEIEIEANALAKEALVPRRIWSKCGARQSLNKNTLLSFSNEYEIHPSIVAGLIRREKNNYKIFSDLVSCLDVRAILKNTL